MERSFNLFDLPTEIDSAVINNNIVLAAIGSEGTDVVKKIIPQWIAQGDKVVVFKYGKSYNDLIKANSYKEVNDSEILKNVDSTPNTTLAEGVTFINFTFEPSNKDVYFVNQVYKTVFDTIRWYCFDTDFQNTVHIVIDDKSIITPATPLMIRQLPKEYSVVLVGQFPAKKVLPEFATVVVLDGQGGAKIITTDKASYQMAATHLYTKLEWFLPLAYGFETIVNTNSTYSIVYKDLNLVCNTNTTDINKAMKIAELQKQEKITVLYNAGQAIPLPNDDNKYSGELRVRFPKSLHKNLAEQAEKEGISLNQFIIYKLTQSLYRNFKATPHFPLPTSMEGQAFLGYCVSTETGDVTNLEYRFNKVNMMHTLIVGASGTGKTETAIQYVSECINHMGIGATILDTKNTWRKLLFLVENPQRVKFYSCGATPVSKLDFNILAIPECVTVELWIEAVVEGFILGFGLGRTCYEIVRRNVESLYRKHGVFEDVRNSENTTMMDLFEEVYTDATTVRHNEEFEFRDTEAYNRVLAKLGCFKYEYSSVYSMFGNPKNPIPLKDLCKTGTVTVIEAGGLKGPVKSFVLGVISTGIFLYGRAMQEIKPENSFVDTKHMVVIEDAHEIVKGAGGEGTIEVSGQEMMWNEGRSVGLILVAVAQTSSTLSPSILGNTATFLIHGLESSNDAHEMCRRIGKNPEDENEDILGFIERIPRGYCIVQARNVRHCINAEPTYIQVTMKGASWPTHEQMSTHMKRFFGYENNDEFRIK